MEVIFRIIPQEKLIIEKYTGEFNLNDYIRIKEQEYSHPEFRPHFNLLIDLRNANPTEQTQPDKVAKSIAEYLKSRSEKVAKRKTAFITSEPFQVVNTILYSDIAKTSLPISVNRFSTVEAAMDWLGISDKKLIIKELENLH